jgi:hypothetical protein
MIASRRLLISPIGGMDERIPQAPQAADLIENWTTHRRSQGWDDRIGYEKYLSAQSAFAPWTTTGRVDSLFIWPRHQGAQEWVLIEADGTLAFLKPYQGQVTDIATGRNVPAPSETSTTFTPMGKWLIILNGIDEPIKYAGWPVDIPVGTYSGPMPTERLGWASRAQSPESWEVNNNPKTERGGNYVGIVNAHGISNLYHPNDPDTFLGDSEGQYYWEHPSSGEVWATITPKENRYYYRVSYVNSSGSEGPISGSSGVVNWEAVKYQPDNVTPGTGYADNDYANKTYGTTMVLPTGPPGTVARRVYRTKSDGVANFYFVGQVDNNVETVFYDMLPDAALGSQAPSEGDSIVFPSPRARFAAVFKNCLFIDGGSEYDTRLYWSDPGTPDTYKALSFTDVGTRKGGAITALHSHYGALFVFREKAIDVVQGDYNSGFQVSTLIQDVGCRSDKTITTIPDIGVCFLSEDGIYMIKGGLQGGATVEAVKLTKNIEGTFERINKDLLPRAVGEYSAKWREYHVYCAVDGEDRPNLGIVFHLDTMAFSVRTGFPVGCIAANYFGDLVFGHRTGAPIGGAESGLFVITRTRHRGYQVVGESITLRDPPTSIFKSPFHAFEDATLKKFVKFVYLYLITGGDNTISLTYYKDFRYSGTVSPSMKQQVPDAADQHVYDTAVLGTAVWERGQVTEIRFPIADGACSHFQWELSTTNDVVLVGYSIEYTSSGTRTITGKRI